MEPNARPADQPTPPAAPSPDTADQPVTPTDQPEPEAPPTSLLQHGLHVARDLVPRLSALALTLYVNSDPILFMGGLGIHGKK